MTGKEDTMTSVIGSVTSAYQNNYTKVQDKKTEEQADKTEEKKSFSSEAAVYEKTTEIPDNSNYVINRKNQTDRDAIVAQLKSDLENRQKQLIDIVNKTLNGQTKAYGLGSGDEFWQKLASGDVKVDAATAAQAKKDIGEDGYWGVKQTSQRLFDFASALAGDDVEKMKKMQSAMEKGFKEATKSWGRELPSISKDTLEAANKLFDDYYASKETKTDS